MEHENFAGNDFAKMLMDHLREVNRVFGEDKHGAIPIFEDAVSYPTDAVVELFRISEAVVRELDPAKRDELIRLFSEKRNEIRPLENAPERIYLWDKDNMPTETEYAENPNHQYNHDPDFRPYMMPVLIPEDETPKGAVVICAGGDHGESVLYEGYQVARELNSLGYQCFVLLNRTNMNPWTAMEAGADAARAIRIVRKNAEKYRISENCVAFAGFSNGGLTGEACIGYYSGGKTVRDHFPEYVPDELDGLSGAPDAFLNIYGPRFKDAPFDYTGVVYPPTFLAVGREDFGMENLNYTYPDLVAHGVQVEIHTFAATGHGVAGRTLIDGADANPGFQLWLKLADLFMLDVYEKRDNPHVSNPFGL